MKSKYLSAAAALLCAAGLAACGGGKGSLSLGVQVYGLDRPGLVLQNNGGNDLTVDAAGTYYFSELMAPDASFNVTVRTVPAFVKCTAANNTGKINYYTYTQTVVTCIPDAFTLGGKVSGLHGDGLVLANGARTVAVANNATDWHFTDPVPNGSIYGVTVLSQPTYLNQSGQTVSQTCVVTNGTKAMPTYAVDDVTVTCSN
jgi:hypothetical protein